MKKLLLFLLLIVTTLSYAGNPICGLGYSGRNKAKDDVKKELVEDFGSNYSLIKSLLDADMRAYDAICKIRKSTIDDEILSNLIEFYPNFSLILSLYKNDKKAYEELQEESSGKKGCSFRC